MIISLIKGLLPKQSKEEIIEIAKSVNAMLENCDNIIQAPVGINCTKVIEIDDIAYAKGVKRQSELKLKNGESYIIPFPINELQDRLEAEQSRFKIVMKDTIINLDAIAKYDSYRLIVVMGSGDEVDVIGDAMKQIIQKELPYLEDMDKGRKRWEYSPLVRRKRETELI